MYYGLTLFTMFLNNFFFTLVILAFTALLQSDVECTSSCVALVNPMRGPLLRISGCPFAGNQKFKKPPNCKLLQQCRQEKLILSTTTLKTTTTTTTKPTTPKIQEKTTTTLKTTTTTTTKPTTTTTTTKPTTPKIQLQTTTPAVDSSYQPIVEQIVKGIFVTDSNNQTK